MNSDEIFNLIKQLLTLASGVAVGVGLLTSEQATSLTSYLIIGVPAMIGAGSVIWSVYAHWRMKKVPVASTAIIAPGNVPLPVGDTVKITGVGVARVVG
jgi:uncharacterized membrane protein YebE (DUF533 family)